MPKLQTNGAKQKRTTYMILLLWTAVCFALLVVDWCCWAPNRLDADMASEQLLANLLAQEGSVMSTSWYYSTELRVLNTQLVMAPLFRLFTSWHTVRVVGSVVLILLYLAAWFWFGRSAKLNSTMPAAGASRRPPRRMRTAHPSTTKLMAMCGI